MTKKMGDKTNVAEGGSVGGGGKYGHCFIECQKVIWTSIFDFFDRIFSFWWLRVQNCWKETYQKCSKTGSGFWGWIKKIFCVLWQTFVNILCTIFYTLMLIISIFWYIFLFIWAFLKCFIYPCPVNEAPHISNCDDLVSKLRNTVNDELGWIETSTGFFGTVAKETGISNGWEKYDLWVITTGNVEHSADSSDGLKTVDIRLISLSLFENNNYKDIKCSSKFSSENNRYLRAEIFPQVLLAYSGRDIEVGDLIQIKGRLFWDRDGFLEVHPENGADIRNTLSKFNFA